MSGKDRPNFMTYKKKKNWKEKIFSFHDHLSWRNICGSNTSNQNPLLIQSAHLITASYPNFPFSFQREHSSNALGLFTEACSS